MRHVNDVKHSHNIHITTAAFLNGLPTAGDKRLDGGLPKEKKDVRIIIIIIINNALMIDALNFYIFGIPPFIKYMMVKGEVSASYYKIIFKRKKERKAKCDEKRMREKK